MTQTDISTLSLLVVDDEPEVRDLVAKVLRRLGVSNVQTASGGNEACAMVQVQQFDALICDLQMPDGDGLSLIRALGAVRGPSHIILMTAAGEEELEQAARLAEASSLAVVARLVKPVTPSMLAAALGTLVAGATTSSGEGRSARHDSGPGPLTPDSIPHFVHEAAAPLMTIRMLTEFLLEDGELAPAQADDVRKIRQAGDELARLIKQLR